MTVYMPTLGRALVAGHRPTTVRALPPMSARIGFGEVMRRYRLARGWSQEQLAEAAKTDKTTISNYETDHEKVPSHDLAQRIINALGAADPLFLVAMGYKVDLPADLLPIIEAAILNESGISDERKQAGLVVIRDMFALGRQKTG